MKQLDEKVAISESILTDLLLDNAGINRQERIMVITAMAGSVKTEECEKALIKIAFAQRQRKRRMSARMNAWTSATAHRSVHKVYCLDCDTIVEETPQRVHKMGKDLASQIQSSSLKQQDLTRRHLDEIELTRMEAGDIIKKFRQALGQEVV